VWVVELTYFKLVLGFECGVDKNVCTLGYPDYCSRCIYKKLSEANIIVDKVDAVEQDTDEKRQLMTYKHIWTKYKDVLNIRHIIVLSLDGMPAFNMAVGDHPFDATLLSGFIQANIIFSKEGLTQKDKNEIIEADVDRNFYEFQYKNFNILLKNGAKSRVCLILETSASQNLRELLSNFVDIFERQYKDAISRFERTGKLELLATARDLVEKTFEINMIYPQSFSSQMPPSVFEKFNLVQKAVYDFGNDLLKDKPYFFIPNLLNRTARILGTIPRDEILWNIYQMIRDEIIIYKDLAFTRDEIELQEQRIKERADEIQLILEKREIKDIIEECKFLSVEEAKRKMNIYLKKGDIAKKNAMYQESLDEYEKALAYAKEFDIQPEVGKISFQVLEVLKLNKQVELDFAKDQVNKFEKKKDYVKALKYLFEVKDLLISSYDVEKNEKSLARTEQHIKKIQNLLR